MPVEFLRSSKLCLTTLTSQAAYRSSISITLASEWYRNCVQCHSRCKVGKDIHPTRVIDLGTDGQESQPVLFEAAAVFRGSYTILSHCWGDDEPMTIQQDEKFPHAWRFPPLSLWPQTFQDAVIVTRALKLRYLWIDTCCIFQGNRIDWETEASKMAQYYRNAAFTTEAKFGASGKDGIFSVRNPMMTYPFKVAVPSGNGRQAKDFFVRLAVDESPRKGTCSRSVSLRELNFNSCKRSRFPQLSPGVTLTLRHCA